jgi:hypothetical protein
MDGTIKILQNGNQISKQSGGNPANDHGADQGKFPGIPTL